MKYIFCASPEQPEMAEAWRTAFTDVEGVEVVVENIFDVSCDAIVSPANSQGDMSGGLDLFIDSYYDKTAEAVVQKMIGGEFPSQLLPVGKARIVCFEGYDIPYLVVAPTMERIGERLDSIENFLNVNRAMTAILREIDYFNWRRKGAIERVAVPALGAGVGTKGFPQVAMQMRDSWDQFHKFKDKYRKAYPECKRYL